MKRKLNADNVPETVNVSTPQDQGTGFEQFGLDARLLQSIRKEGFSQPTPVQVQTIPPALKGRDILGTGFPRFNYYIFNSYCSSLQNGIWKDCRIRPTGTSINPEAQDRPSVHTTHICPYTSTDARISRSGHKSC